MIKCKMVVTSKSDNFSHYDSTFQSSTVKLLPVCGNSEENKTWSKWTPSGQIELQISNPDAYSIFELGKEYYVDFTKVENEQVSK